MEDKIKLIGIRLGKETELPEAVSGSTYPAKFDRLLDDFSLKVKNPERKSYKPALTAVHSKSRGMVQRILGSVTGREHHLLSRYERSVFLAAEFTSGVTDIREQFGVPVELTKALCQIVGFEHPWHNDAPSLFSVDFLLVFQSAGIRGQSYVAVDFKMARHLVPRAEKKLQIAALALSFLGIPHYIVTENDINDQCLRNLRWLHVYRLAIEPSPLDPEIIQQIEPDLRLALESSGASIYSAARDVSRRLGIPASTLSRSCYWLAANFWDVDYTSPIGPDYPLRFLRKSI